ncbi:MAG: MFS transporter [Syntrophorhabdales bacterium]
MGKMEGQRRLYGRYIVGASFLILFFYSGAQYAFGVMFKPVVREFGWSRSAVSLVFLVNMVVFAIALTIVGRLYDRFGPKWIIIISTLFLSAGFVLTSFIHSLGQFFFSYGIMAALGLAGTGVPLISTLVSKWFDRGRGLAISLSLAGSSVGAFVLVRLLSLFAVSYGWRTSYFYLGIVMLLVNSLLAIFVIRGDPRHLGMAEDTKYSDEDAGGVKGPAGMGLRQAMATRSFWLFLATMFVCGSGDYLATSHFINFATDIGVSPIIAGNMMSWYGLFSFAGMLVAGPAADRIGSKMPVVLTFVLRFLLYLFIVRYKNVPSLYMFALLFGFTHLITAPLTPMLMGRLYGFRQIGLLTGVVNTVHFLGGGIFTYATGLIFDRTGSYQMAFIIAAAMAAAAALCSSLIAEKSHTPGSLTAEARTSFPTAC